MGALTRRGTETRRLSGRKRVPCAFVLLCSRGGGAATTGAGGGGSTQPRREATTTRRDETNTTNTRNNQDAKTKRLAASPSCSNRDTQTRRHTTRRCDASWLWRSADAQPGEALRVVAAWARRCGGPKQQGNSDAPRRRRFYHAVLQAVTKRE